MSTTVSDILGLGTAQTDYRPGAGIKPFDPMEGKAHSYRSVVNDYKVRYAFMPLYEIPLFGRHISGPMSISRVLRGRLNYIQPCPYRHRDESDAAMLTYSTDWDSNELAESVNTPFAQALFLSESYSDRGLMILDSLTGLDAELVTLFEEIVLPKIPDNVIAFASYIRMYSAKALIENANLFPAQLLPNFKQALKDMVTACAQAEKWAKDYITAREAEIQTARAGKGGAEGLDDFDLMLYGQIDRRPIEARKVKREGDSDDAEDRLVRVLTRALGKTDVQVESGILEEMRAMRAELNALKNGKVIEETPSEVSEPEQPPVEGSEDSSEEVPDLSTVSLPLDSSFSEQAAAREAEIMNDLPETLEEASKIGGQSRSQRNRSNKARR
jgi:hypothetical protein